MKISSAISELASTIAGAQLSLDNEAQRDVLLWQAFCADPQLTPALEPVIKPLIVNPLRVSTLTLQTGFHLQQQQDSSIDIGITLLAQPVSGFYRKRFNRNQSLESRVEMVCVAAPVDPAAG
jgi:hypothetical protein